MRSLGWKRCLLIVVFAAQAVPAIAAIEAVRIKDLGRMQGWRDNAIVGYGVVTGLAGTGDSPANRTTRQAMANILSKFDMAIGPEQVQSRNVAVVMVTASMPTFAREGDRLDVVVTSSGDARSLVGGTLLLTSLKAANGRVYALAQGPLSVGGYRYDANGNVVQKNHPTVGSVPGGATVEVGLNASVVRNERNVTFVLAEPDYTTAQRIAAAINTQVGPGLARPYDASGIDIRIPEGYLDSVVDYLARVENVTVAPDRRARVVIDERTGTVVSGGDVTISPVAISHGDIKVSVATENYASQPFVLGGYAPGVSTAIVSNSTLSVEEINGPSYVGPDKSTVADLVQALARMKTNTRDVISILRAVKAAGALHAELIVQ
ncbi:MAG: flagellar basal body P-ring protein FlgI [Rhodocyclaceae bacterium]